MALERPISSALRMLLGICRITVPMPLRSAKTLTRKRAAAVSCAKSVSQVSFHWDPVPLRSDREDHRLHLLGRDDGQIRLRHHVAVDPQHRRATRGQVEVGRLLLDHQRQQRLDLGASPRVGGAGQVGAGGGRGRRGGVDRSWGGSRRRRHGGGGRAAGARPGRLRRRWGPPSKPAASCRWERRARACRRPRIRAWSGRPRRRGWDSERSWPRPWRRPPSGTEPPRSPTARHDLPIGNSKALGRVEPAGKRAAARG